MQAGFEPVDAAPPAPGDGDHGWRFVTDHARVLEAIAQDPTTRQRDIARIAGVTERPPGRSSTISSARAISRRRGTDAATATRCTAISRCATSGTAIAPSGS